MIDPKEFNLNINNDNDCRLLLMEIAIVKYMCQIKDICLVIDRCNAWNRIDEIPNYLFNEIKITSEDEEKYDFPLDKFISNKFEDIENEIKRHLIYGKFSNDAKEIIIFMFETGNKKRKTKEHFCSKWKGNKRVNKVFREIEGKYNDNIISEKDFEKLKGKHELKMEKIRDKIRHLEEKI